MCSYNNWCFVYRNIDLAPNDIDIDDYWSEDNMKLVITKGSKYEQIKASLIQTDNYCPCVPKYARSEDNKCMCKEFKEQKTEGECHCGMWEKVLISEF